MLFYLRAGYFMENILGQVGVIQSFGVVAGPVRPELPLPMIATRDIGAAAAEALLKLDFNGKHTRELQGPRDVTYNDVAKISGRGDWQSPRSEIYANACRAVIEACITTQMGMSSNMTDLLLEMSESLNSDYMKKLEARSPANSTPTTLSKPSWPKFSSRRIAARRLGLNPNSPVALQNTKRVPSCVVLGWGDSAPRHRFAFFFINMGGALSTSPTR